MKDLRRMLLRLERHPLMDQQMSHIYIRIAQVCAECILTIKIIKNTSAGVLSEILAALMARAVEFRISSLDILHQTFEERRQDPGLILLGCTFDLTLVVFLRSPGKIQNAIRLPQDVLTQLFPFLDNQKHGDAKGRKMRIPKDPAILLRDDDSSCFRQIAVFQTYTLPSFDLTYHAPGFITVRNFQSRLHPSILLSHPHSPYKPSIKKRSSPSYRRTCTLSNRRNAMNRIRMSSQEALSSLSPLFHETSFTAHTSCPSSVWHGTQEADPVPFPSDCTRHGAEFR